MERVYAIILIPLLFCLLVRMMFRWMQDSRQPKEGAETDERPQHTWKEKRTVFFYALAFRILMLLVGVLVLGLFTNGGAQPETLESAMRIWDGRHYSELIKNGYAGYQENGKHLFLVFFPLYVWVSRLFYYLFQNVFAAGLFVSVLSFSFASVYLYLLVKGRYNAGIAKRTLLLLSLFPYSLFFGTMMTESLFLLTTAASLYYISRHQWFAAGLWGALAALTRMTGLLLAGAIFVELFECYHPFADTREKAMQALKKIAARLVFVLLPGVGTLAYLMLNLSVDGNCLAFLSHQQHWHQGGVPLPRAMETITQYMQTHANDGLGAGIWIPEFILFFLGLVLLFVAVLKRRGSGNSQQFRHPSFLLFYGLAYLITTYSLSWLLSGGRYLSCAIPFFIIVAVLLENKRNATQFILACSAILLGIYYSSYLMGGQIL